jgi:hypothetical protein
VRLPAATCAFRPTGAPRPEGLSWLSLVALPNYPRTRGGHRTRTPSRIPLRIPSGVPSVATFIPAGIATSGQLASQWPLQGIARGPSGVIPVGAGSGAPTRAGPPQHSSGVAAGRRPPECLVEKIRDRVSIGDRSASPPRRGRRGRPSIIAAGVPYPHHPTCMPAAAHLRGHLASHGRTTSGSPSGRPARTH